MSISEHATGNSSIKGAVPQSASNSYNSSASSSSSNASTSAVTSTQKSKKSTASGLPGAVSHIYYKHGLFLSSYPTCATSIAIVAILFSW